MLVKASRDLIPSEIKFAEGVRLRLLIYLLLFLGYVAFMNRYAPAGLDWAFYHSQRLFNAVEYLRLNGYGSAFGFSIWSSCADCNLLDPSWHEKIYLSGSALLGLWPYMVLNELGGKAFFHLAGPILDQTIIFITGVLLAELLLALMNVSTGLTRKMHKLEEEIQDQAVLTVHWLGAATFFLFCSSIWTYQMYRALWNETWFLFFFLVSFSLLLKNKFRLACLAIVMGACMHYILGFVLACVYISFYILSIIFREEQVFNSVMPSALNSPSKLLIYSSYSAIPTLIQFGLRFAYSASTGMQGEGSSLFYRMGVSGDDIHNGGILGALQFLGGARITQCVTPLFKEGLENASLDSKITAFNCTLSISGLTMVSILAILGVFWLLANYKQTRVLIFPIGMSLIILASTLQQSFSAHLLGHSYPFAAIFAIGMVGLGVKASRGLKSNALSILVLTPLTAAIVLLSIRVSMLTALATG